MNEVISTILLVTTICFNPTLGRPGLLKQQRYEFQDFHSSSSQGHNARLEVATIPEQHEPILWSQQHQNEVNAFAEIFRQTYNQMVEQHNERMQMAHHALTNPFMPVTYVLYDVPNEGFWRNYFGNQQQYVYHQTELMSRQLIQELEEGRVSPQEVMNPNFFVAQAASELNRVHHAQNEFGSNDQQVASSSVNTYQQHHFDTFEDQQQQHQIFAETHHLAEDSKQAQEYNQKAGEYQFVTVVAASEKPQYEELAGEMTSNANVQHLSYIQRLPPVTFNNEKLNRFNQEVEQIEVYTSVSPRLSQQHLNEEVNKPLETAVDEFYGSTYDQQPIYDMQFVESVSSTVKPSMVNVMSLVRNKTKVKPSTTTSAPATTTTTTTTELPTTESSIMSLLPNKKPSFNYTDIAHKVRAELDKQMKNTHNNKSEETHFMGMTSNIDHVKLSYDTIIDAKDHKESRGDQPSKTDDYIYEEYVESEPGLGTYSVSTEPEPGLVVSTVSVKSPSSTPSPIPSTAASIRVSSNPFNPTPSVPFPTTTTKPPNPYYSAPLAPFPDNIWQVQATAQSQAEHFEHSDTTHTQTHVIDHSNDSHFVVEDTNHELNEQRYEDILEHHEEFHISHDMQQYEDVQVQQRYIDFAGGHEMTGQRYEQQLPPEQEYRDPYSQHSVAGLNGNSDIPAHVQEITPATVEHKTQKNNWFQQKLSKFKNLF